MHLYNGPPPQGRTVRFLRNNRYLYGMKITKKQAIGENLLYVMVWLAIILVPVLNSQMMSELHISLENVLIAWRKIAPYLIVFIVHNAIIAPRLMLRHRYALYLVVNLLFIIAVFWAVDLYDQYFSTPLLFTEEEPFDEHRKASFTDLELYWNVVLALFMTGANSGIKLMYQKNWAKMSMVSPLPMSSSMYLHVNCIISTNRLTKNAPASIIRKLRVTNRSSFFMYFILSVKVHFPLIGKITTIYALLCAFCAYN